MSRETPQEAARRFAAKLIAQGYSPLALHVYCDAQEKPLYWRIRLKHPQSGEKWIRPMHVDESGQFILEEPKFLENKKPLYHLPLLLKYPNETVWITEGEFCADKLIKLGLIATTSGGVESIDGTDWNPLANRSIIIWPDNDVAGTRYAQALTHHLQRLNCNVQWIDVKALQLPDKGDCVDWLQQHPDATVEAVKQLTLISLLSTQDSAVLDEVDIEKKAEARFVVREDGVYFQNDDVEMRICSKLEIKALVRDKASENWGRLLVFADADNHTHQWAMPMAMLSGGGEEIRGQLLNLGLEIAPGARARHLLTEYIMMSKPHARARCVHRTGWYHTAFVLPQQTLGETDEYVIYQAESLSKDYQTNGSLADWQQHVAKLCIGNSRLVLAMSAAFAAMLLPLANSESGGLHLVGESSSGKTTALRIAASVYGAPDYLHRWRATTNGLEALAALRSDTLLILDELAQVDPKEAGEIAYMLANGSGKTRANKSGGSRSRYEWRLLFLSAGEIGLAQHMREAGKKIKAGQEVRLVDIPADTGNQLGIFENLHSFESGAALSKALLEATMQYYGTAAIAFLERLTSVANLTALPEMIRDLRQQFIHENLPEHASGQVHRVCERFALIAIAGELATHYGITLWSTQEAERAAVTCFKAWLEQRGSAGNLERSALLAQVQAFFEAHGASRFETLPALNEQRIINRMGFKRSTPEGEVEYLVLPEMFRRELCAGFDPRWAAQILIEVGLIKPSSEGKAQTAHRIAHEGVRKCYHFIKTELDHEK